MTCCHNTVVARTDNTVSVSPWFSWSGSPSGRGEDLALGTTASGSSELPLVTRPLLSSPHHIAVNLPQSPHRVC